MILVCTIGRSGSSFLMKFLSECEVDIGTDQWFDTFNAGLEHRDVCSINAELISHLIKGKNINHYRVWADIYDLKLPVYKDPQFLMHPMIIKNWWTVRQDIKIVYLYRNHEAIAESQKKIPAWTCPVYRCFPEMMAKQEKDFLRQVNLLNIPIEVFKFPNFLGDPKKVIEKLRYWAHLPDNAEEIWRNLLDGKAHR